MSTSAFFLLFSFSVLRDSLSLKFHVKLLQLLIALSGCVVSHEKRIANLVPNDKPVLLQLQLPDASTFHFDTAKKKQLGNVSKLSIVNHMQEV